MILKRVLIDFQQGPCFEDASNNIIETNNLTNYIYGTHKVFHHSELNTLENKLKSLRFF